MKQTRNRAKTGEPQKAGTLILRCSRELVANIDLEVARDPKNPTRSEMARRLIEAGLVAHRGDAGDR